ncbi:DUF3613 domain-containing protein [Halomonas getboli]|uniref:DUF3613 domain-containing protein n=1 Tax=Halomonas getboli TaxID=2935862 RepID=UPI001FFF6F08|nr:DUF3613 domain-containing protein [Halomonas getboli]MCK2183433.1 DUF3613 domain-containing protein [Halomonas getboli]
MRANGRSKRLRPLGALGLAVVLAAPMMAWGQGSQHIAQTATSRSAVPTRVAPHQTEFGERTQRLLDLQRSGRVASPRRQTLSGEVQTQAYRRYVESFSQPIPDQYIDLSFGE